MHTSPSTIEAHESVPRDRWRKLSLGAGLFAGPAAWAMQLQVVYALVPWACKHHRTYLLHVMTATFLLVSVAGGLLAWREWRRVGGGWPSGTEGDPDTRSRFMAVLGIFTSALFTLVILAQWVPAFVFDPCQD
jgi:hypothetical protein